MTKKPSIYLIGLLLAFGSAAAPAQNLRPDQSKPQLKPQTQPQGQEVLPAGVLQPGQMVVARRDTMVVTKRDTVIVEKVDTAYVTKYDTLSADMLHKKDTVIAGQMTDAALINAVRIAVMQALQQSGGGAEIDPRPDYLKTWDRMQDKRKIHRVDRELMRAVFVPKGQWLLGATFNYQEWDTENINLLVLKNIDIEGHTFSGSPYLGYFVKNNLAIGGRYNYSRNYFFLGQFDLNLGEDFNISLADLYYLEHTHEATFFLRTYQSLGRANIFGFFGDIRATYAYSQSKNTTGSGADFEGSYSTGHTLQLSFCPGMSAFVTDFLAAEASIGVLGLKYGWKDQQTNRVETGTKRSGGLNFKFNFLSISLGLTFYL